MQPAEWFWVICPGTPGRKSGVGPKWTTPGFYRYIEAFYGITGREKLDNALLIVSAQNRINGVKSYLQGLTWDGKKRVDTLLSDYLGADDTLYTRQ